MAVLGGDVLLRLVSYIFSFIVLSLASSFFFLRLAGLELLKASEAFRFV